MDQVSKKDFLLLGALQENPAKTVIHLCHAEETTLMSQIHKS